MDENYDVENQPSTCCENKQSYFARSCCLVFVLIICVIVVFSVIFAFNQKPIDLGLDQVFNLSSKEEQEATRSPNFSSHKFNYRRFTFDQLFSGKQFLRDEYRYLWMPDGSFVYDREDFSIEPKSASKIPLSTLTPDELHNEYDMWKTMSSDGNYAYESKFVEKVFRHSKDEVYYIVKVVNGSASNDTYHVGPEPDALIQAFYWNPNRKSHDFVYVHNYNLYHQKDPENPAGAIQLTVDGTFFSRFGIPNWLYEEEIMEKGAWWSPSGRYVSYLKFDDREVNRVFLPKYTDEDNYVEYFELPYPKAGVVHNTLVTQYIWDSESHKIVETAPPNELSRSNGSFYVLQNTWIKMPENVRDLGAERLVTVWSNREQNHIYYSLCNEQDCVMTYSQSFKIDNRSMWAEPKEVGDIHATASGFFTILPHKYKDGNIYNHVAHIELEITGTGKISKWIGEDADVIQIIGYSSEYDVLTIRSYGTGIGENHVYKIPEAAKSGHKTTIQKVNEIIGDCGYLADVSSDDSGSRLMLQCQEPFENARLYLIDTDDISKRVMLEGNQKVFLPFDQPKMEFGKFKLPSGIDGHYMIMSPPKLTPGKKYPLLVELYGGPNSKKVMRKTPPPQMIQICSEYEVFVVQIDVRGTAGRGWNVKEAMYRHLGEPEADDTLDMIHRILNKYSYIDDEKVAIMGWSYGGYLTAKIATKDQGETVKCALSIAPVTDFKYYDTAYTERYLGLMQDNLEGYQKTNIIPYAKNMTNVKYFLAHGERDDNVHYQNSARWSEALQSNGIHFTQLVYANEAHGLIRKYQHLYSEVERFLVHDCFTSNSDLF